MSAELLLKKLRSQKWTRDYSEGVAELKRLCSQATAALPPVLDPCCGSRMWWFDKANPLVLYGDRRCETLEVTDRSHGRADGTRTLCVNPDVVMDFRAMPFPDESFHLVAFDPPHLVRAGKKSWLAAKYGKLGPDWRADLRAGFAECFRVLRPHGVLVFKWNETQVKISEILPLSPVAPLFGNTSGRKSGTPWMGFIKPGPPSFFSEEVPDR